MLKRYNVMVLVSPVCFLFCVVAGGVFVKFLPTDPPGAVYGVVLGMFALFGWIQVVMLHVDLRRQWKEGNAMISSITATFLPATEVRRVLGKLATDFSMACKSQQEIQNLDTAEAELEDRARVVKIRKNLFWEAYGLANKIGYPFKGKLSDYLPEEEKAA